MLRARLSRSRSWRSVRTLDEVTTAESGSRQGNLSASNCSSDCARYNAARSLPPMSSLHEGNELWGTHCE